MSYIRSDGMGFPDPEQDAVIQTIIGDLKRLRLMIERGADSSAYVRRDQALTDLKNPEAAMQQVLQQYITAGGGGFPLTGTLVGTTTYNGGAAGTHACNAATTHVIVYAVGGGAGGGDGWISTGGTGYYGGGGGGGGAGGWAQMWAQVSGGDSIAYTVGSGGSGGGSGDGVDGGDSSVGLVASTITIGGGKKGIWADASSAAGTWGQGGLGGQAVFTSMLNPFIISGSGCNGSNGAMGYMFNAGPPPTFYGVAGLGGVGNRGYGAGGNGAYYDAGGSTGGDGVVIITEYTAS